MALRVSAGWLKGSVLKTPAGRATRPTTSRVREAVMDMLRGRLDGAVLLELFAGSGAFSLEALSRGAQKAVLVENDRDALTALRSNLELAKTRAEKQGIKPPQTVLLGIDLARGWKQCAAHGPFDLVWVDPPYDEVARWLPLLWHELPALLTPEGIFILECDRDGERCLLEIIREEKGAGLWQIFKQKRYGDTYITMLNHASGAKTEASSADEAEGATP